ncbi:MAG: tetratricopeptide repeat protein [Chloroflexi bacterium]|nr:tetratricopeptide repeat protein [Chloroflexota bacterium]
MTATADDADDFDRLWDYNHPAETEQRLRALLPQMTEPSRRAELLTQIARAQGLQRRFEAAHATLDEVEPLLTSDHARPTIRYLLERGRVFNSSRQPEQASSLFRQAWEQARAAGQDFYAIDAAHMLAISEPPEHQLEWNLQALRLAEATSEPRGRGWRGSLYNNIGWTYHDQERYVEALECFEKALLCRQEAGDQSTIRIARWCVARCLRSLGRVSEALAILRELEAEHAAVGGSDGYVYEELAECLALNQDPAAQAYFALAYAQLSADPWLAEAEPARLERLRLLGAQQ